MWGPPAVYKFGISNSPPSQPLVEILPKPAKPGQDLIMNALVYSEDPDGDPIAYDYAWFKSTDGGKTWIHKIELDNLPFLLGLYAKKGELWEVHCTPYEDYYRTQDQTKGAYGWDRVYIGDDNPPSLTLATPSARREVTGGVRLSLKWQFTGAAPCTVDLDWTDMKSSGLVSLAQNLPAQQLAWTGVAQLPLDRPVYLHGIIRDAKGAVMQVLSPRHDHHRRQPRPDCQIHAWQNH